MEQTISPLTETSKSGEQDYVSKADNSTEALKLTGKTVVGYQENNQPNVLILNEVCTGDECETSGSLKLTPTTVADSNTITEPVVDHPLVEIIPCQQQQREGSVHSQESNNHFVSHHQTEISRNDHVKSSDQSKKLFSSDQDEEKCIKLTEVPRPATQVRVENSDSPQRTVNEAVSGSDSAVRVGTYSIETSSPTPHCADNVDGSSNEVKLEGQVIVETPNLIIYFRTSNPTELINEVDLLGISKEIENSTQKPQVHVDFQTEIPATKTSAHMTACSDKSHSSDKADQKMLLSSEKTVRLSSNRKRPRQSDPVNEKREEKNRMRQQRKQQQQRHQQQCSTCAEIVTDVCKSAAVSAEKSDNKTISPDMTEREIKRVLHKKYLSDGAEASVKKEQSSEKGQNEDIGKEISFETSPEASHESSSRVGSKINGLEELKHSTMKEKYDIVEHLNNLKQRKFVDEILMKCTFCEKTFSGKYRFHRHLEIHASEMPFCCNICEKKFSAEAQCLKHVKIHTGRKKLYCRVCEKKFELNGKYVQHLIRCHIGEAQYQCNSCEKFFPSKNECLDHEKNVHSDERTFKCQMCPKSFRLKGNFIQHLKTHIGIKPFSCNICSKSFPRRIHLDHHLATHTGKKPYLCDVCGKAFAAKSDHERHTRIHSDEKPYKCHICGHAVRIKNNLIRHMRSHNGERPHKCPLCPKRFAEKSTLNIHERKHSGEKPYQCETCGKLFSSRPEVSQHIKTHSGERPFPCKFCSKYFTTKGNLQRHLKIHTGEKPFTCNFCEKKFIQLSNLKQHVATHLPCHMRSSKEANSKKQLSHKKCSKEAEKTTE